MSYISTKDTHDREVKVRLTETDEQLLKAKAAQSDIPVAVYARKCVLEELRGITPEVEFQILDELCREITDVPLSEFESLAEAKYALRCFRKQREGAARRGIAWEFTFRDWWTVWRDSGMWGVRGKGHRAAAVMARRGDEGPYSKENVRITTVSDNCSEAQRTKKRRQLLTIKSLH